MLALCCCNRKFLRAFCAAVMAAIRCSTDSTDDFPSTEGWDMLVMFTGLMLSLVLLLLPVVLFAGVEA